jgi:putative isomerase
MANLSRRDLLGSMAIAGVTSLTTADSLMSYETGSLRAPAPHRKEAAQLILDYFSRTGRTLFRHPEGHLKHPTISPSQPGKTYSAELWDWDTYWTARGLIKLSKQLRDVEFLRKTIEHAQGSLFSFFDAQSAEGRIPIMISIDNPDLFGSTKTQSVKTHNQAKPVLGQIALMISDEVGDAEWFASRFDQLRHFYDAWEAENLSSVGLYVWGNDVAIGDDNDPTTFGRPNFSSANVMLNSLFYEDLRAASELARRLRRFDNARELQRKADSLKENIQAFCWDPRDRFYYTADVQCIDRRSELLPKVPQGMSMPWKCIPLRIQMFTGFLPLWCGIATWQQANDLLARHYFADDRFRAPYGVRTLSSQETMYSLTAMSGNPSNWLGPVWIIANYFVWRGLLRYGFTSAANELADKTIGLLAAKLKVRNLLK